MSRQGNWWVFQVQIRGSVVLAAKAVVIQCTVYWSHSARGLSLYFGPSTAVMLPARRITYSQALFIRLEELTATSGAKQRSPDN